MRILLCGAFYHTNIFCPDLSGLVRTFCNADLFLVCGLLQSGFFRISLVRTCFSHTNFIRTRFFQCGVVLCGLLLCGLVRTSPNFFRESLLDEFLLCGLLLCRLIRTFLNLCYVDFFYTKFSGRLETFPKLFEPLPCGFLSDRYFLYRFIIILRTHADSCRFTSCESISLIRSSPNLSGPFRISLIRISLKRVFLI